METLRGHSDEARGTGSKQAHFCVSDTETTDKVNHFHGKPLFLKQEGDIHDSGPLHDGGFVCGPPRTEAPTGT